MDWALAIDVDWDLLSVDDLVIGEVHTVEEVAVERHEILVVGSLHFHTRIDGLGSRDLDRINLIQKAKVSVQSATWMQEKESARS